MRLFFVIILICFAHAASAMDTVRVNSVIQLVDSLRSDCMFILEPGQYVLSNHPTVQALDVSQTHKDVRLGEHVRYSSGEGFTLYLLKNVRLEGAGASPSETLLSSALMADEVLTILGCEGIQLKNLQFSHDTGGEGNIKGGLVKISQSTSVKVDHCELFGRAAVGLSTWRSKKVELSDSKIENCSYGVCDLKDSWTIRISNCSFSANKGCQQLWLMSACTDVKIQGNIFADNLQRENKSCESCHMFKFVRCEMVSMENNVLKGNVFDFLGDSEVNRILNASNDTKKNKFVRLSSN